jgi:hypothetical protein
MAATSAYLHASPGDSRARFLCAERFPKESGEFALLVSGTGVMNVLTAASPAQGDLKMKHYTIGNDNNITLHDSRKAARETGDGVFTTEEQFAN